MSSEQPPSIAPRRPVTARTARPVGRTSTSLDSSDVGTTGEVRMPLAGQPAGPPMTRTPVGAPAGAPAAGPGAAPAPVRAPGAVPVGPAAGAPGATPVGTVRTPVAQAARPAPAAEDDGPRRVRLSVARVDPLSVMKLSFLLSVAIGIMIVIAAVVIWETLNQMAVFTKVNEMIGTLSGQPDYNTVLEIASRERVLSLATMIAVADAILLTALSTIMAFLYNIVAALVGGLHLTLTDD